jgi:hypothetical protein
MFTVDKDEYMVGSYGPKTDLQSYTTPIEEAPSGLFIFFVIEIEIVSTCH